MSLSVLSCREDQTKIENSLFRSTRHDMTDNDKHKQISMNSLTHLHCVYFCDKTRLDKTDNDKQQQIFCESGIKQEIRIKHHIITVKKLNHIYILCFVRPQS